MGHARVVPEAAADTSPAVITPATPDDLFQPLNGIDPYTHPVDWHGAYSKMVARAKAHATFGTTPRLVRDWQELARTLITVSGQSVTIPTGKADMTRDWVLSVMAALNAAPQPHLTEEQWMARDDAIPHDLDKSRDGETITFINEIDSLVSGALLCGDITAGARARLQTYRTTTINRLGVAD